jgi:hypothetical protein
MSHDVDVRRFPEWEPFARAVRSRRPDDGTWCEAWTVRDVVVHQTGNAEELARVLAGHLAGEPVATRAFEEREAPYRAMDDDELWSTLIERMRRLGEVARDGERLPADTDVAWTGRTMKVPWFAEHMREELILHAWDIAGDVDEMRALLEQPWMTDHTVRAVGAPLLRKGAAELSAGEHVIERLRVAGADDVVVKVDGDGATVWLEPPTGDATLETDSATRVLLLWGRRPADPARIRSHAGPEALRRLRTVLSGY